MNDISKALLHSLQNDEWKVSEFCVKRKSDGLEIWTANGWMDFNGYHNGLHIPFFDRWFLYRQYKKLIGNHFFPKYSEEQQ